LLYFQALKNDFKRRLRKASFVLEILGIGVVAAYTTVAVLQWWTMNQTLSQATVAATAAVEQAKIANAQLAESERTLKESNRAFIRFTLPLIDFEQLKVRITLVNLGTRPTTGKTVVILKERCGTLENRNRMTLPTKILYFERELYVTNSIDPKSDIPNVLTIGLKGACANIPDILGGNESLEIGGTISYDNGFGDMKDHDFCFTFAGCEANKCSWFPCGTWEFAEHTKNAEQD
jgi:hypothetical protein